MTMVVMLLLLMMTIMKKLGGDDDDEQSVLVRLKLNGLQQNLQVQLYFQANTIQTATLYREIYQALKNSVSVVGKMLRSFSFLLLSPV